jgi:hypothetical protein
MAKNLNAFLKEENNTFKLTSFSFHSMKYFIPIFRIKNSFHEDISNNSSKR